MHDARPRIEARVKKHKRIKTSHHDTCSFKVINVERVNLFFEFFRGYDCMFVTDAKFVENKVMCVGDFVYVSSWLEWFFERVFL